LVPISFAARGGAPLVAPETLPWRGSARCAALVCCGKNNPNFKKY
jgi:hypothetical protein